MERRANLAKNKVSVLGGGSWGTALAILLSGNGNEVVIWEYDKNYVDNMQKDRENRLFLPGFIFNSNLQVTGDLKFAIESSDHIVLVIPSHGFRQTAVVISETDISGKTFISATKGIEIESLKRMSEVLKEEIPGVDDNNIAVLSGPSFAKEVAQKFPTTVTAASTSDEMIKTVQDLFMCDTFRVYGNNDVVGVELGGALKNVMAIASGIVAGVGFGDNTRAALISRGIVEMTRLGISMGADKMTFSGLSGYGDLILTCMGSQSRNLHVGMEIGKGKTLERVLAEMVQVAEGVKTTEAVYRLSNKLNVETPIMTKVHEVLFEGKSPKDAILDLMTREAKAEH